MENKINISESNVTVSLCLFFTFFINFVAVVLIARCFYKNKIAGANDNFPRRNSQKEN